MHFPTKSELQQMKQVEGTIEDRQACHFGRGEGRVKGDDRRQIQLVSTQRVKKHPQRFLNGRLSQRFLSFFHLSSTAGIVLQQTLSSSFLNSQILNW